MFDLKRPCVNCPFRKGQGPLFQLSAERLEEILNAPAFQCHKTFEGRPQQCAGLMSLLDRESQPNQIMQVAERWGEFDPELIDHRDVYETISDALVAHTGDQTCHLEITKRQRLTVRMGTS